MSQQTVRRVIDSLDLPVPYLKNLITRYQIPPIGDRTSYHWEKLERLIREPPTISHNGWTYFEVYNTIAYLLDDKGGQCRIRAPGMPSETVPRGLCHHPYSEKAGGARRWNLERN